MGYGHSMDLRKRVIEAVQAGASARQAARRFAISPSSAIKLVARWRQTGSYAPGQVGGQKKRRLENHKDWLQQVMNCAPDSTLADLQADLAKQGISISQQAINTTLHAWGYRYKKNAARARTRASRSRGAAPAMASGAAADEAPAACVH